SDASFTVHAQGAAQQYTLSAGAASQYALSLGAAASTLGRELLSFVPSAQNFVSAISSGSPGADSGVNIQQLSGGPMSSLQTAANAAAAARAFFDLAPIDAQALFSDALAAFAGQCAAVT